VLAINRARVGSDRPVDYMVADIFNFGPTERYDTIAFGFWLSHVPKERFAAFWEMLAAALIPGGR
jgi:hypothetical protein